MMPLFKSAYDALRFAYNFNGDNCVSPMLGIPPSGNGKGLGGLDGAAEAGNIKRIVATLGIDSEMIIVARFMPDRIICGCGRACCQGWYPSLGWKSAIRHLARILASVCFNDKGSESYRMLMLAHWFKPDNQTIEDIGKVEGYSRSTAYEHFKAVRKFFRSTRTRKGAEQVVIEAVEEQLRKAGIVGEKAE